MNTPLQKIFLSILVVLISCSSFAQKRQIKKANDNFDKFSYIDARKIYLEVVKDGYESAEIFKKLGDTYYWNSDYDNASKWYGELIEKFPDQTDSEYYYRAAQSLKSLRKYAESDAMMEQFVAKGGSGMLLKNFKEDPDYLKSISLMAKEYTLEEVSVNTNLSDFGPSYYLDKLVYASAKNSQGGEIYEWTQQPFLDLFIADMDENGKLSNSKRLGGDINTKYHESSTTFTKDGNTVYFTRNNFYEGKKGKDKDKTIRLKLYRATLTGDNTWTNVVELPFNSKEYSTAHPALSVDEKRLYFSSDMPGTIGMSDLWYVDITGDNTYSAPVNLGPSINTETRESFPFIGSRNNLYFSSDGRAGLGGFDIYVTPLDADGMPQKISNLGEPANSVLDDFGFIVKDDEGIGFLSSNRSLDAEGTNNQGGSVADQIYRIVEKCVISIEGTVFDEESNALLPGSIVTLLDENNKEVMRDTVGADAAYKFVADCSKQYSVRGANEPNYKPREKVVMTPDKTGEIVVPIPLVRTCPPDDLGCRLCLQPIFFDFDRYNIRPDAEIELAQIAAAMRQNPELIIHIESHTDSRAPNSYNETLSDKRAQATLNWLVNVGNISRSRLSAKGYGETQLLDRCVTLDECGREVRSACYDGATVQEKCSDGVKCTEDEHQRNRRSMFIIQN